MPKMPGSHYTPHELEQRHIENLTKLANYLEKLPPENFDMFQFFAEGDADEMSIDGYAFLRPLEVTPRQQRCGFVACAVGHGPDAGIPVKPEHSNWHKYMRDQLIGTDHNLIELESWLFSSGWAKCDNTTQGAVRRIRHLLEYGVPTDFYKDQQHDMDDYYANVHPLT